MRRGRPGEGPRFARRRYPGLSWCDRDGDWVRRGGGDVNQVVANAGPGDHAQLGASEKRSGDIRSPPAIKASIFPRKGRSCSLVKEKSPCGSTTSKPASRRSSERAGLVAKKIGADQNSGHGHLGVSKGMIAENTCSRRTSAADFFSSGPPPPCVGQSPNLFSSKPDGNLVSPRLTGVRGSPAARETLWRAEVDAGMTEKPGTSSRVQTFEAPACGV